MTYKRNSIKFTSFMLKSIACAIVLTGCVDKNQKTSSLQDVSIESIEVEGPSLPKVGSVSVGRLSPHAAELAEAVQQSQARLASARSDVCPKLIEFKVGDTMQVRQNEIMRHQVCKYFMYPRVGDKISVKITNINMKAEMVQPNYFDFVEGIYKVKSPGKHVLQIGYKKHHGNRKSEQYSLIVNQS